MVLSDEIYAELTYGQHHVSPANLTELYDRTVLVNGFSKSHAMTGWRMGYVCAPKPIVAAMTKLPPVRQSCPPPPPASTPPLRPWRNGDGDIEHMREEYDSRRRYLVENLNRIGLTCFEPKGAFYVFPCIKSSGLSSQEFCERFPPGGEGGRHPRRRLRPRRRGLCAGLLRRLHEGHRRGGEPYGQLPSEPEGQRN